ATVGAGSDPAGYLADNNPVQSEVIKVLEQYCETSITNVGVDGCSAPTPVLSLAAFACAFVKLGPAGSGRHADVPGDTFARALLEYPTAVQGNNRLDTVVLDLLGLVTKTGADGVLAMAAPDGTAVAVSMIDSTHRATHLIALVLLAQYAPDALSLQDMSEVIERFVPPIYGGNQAVGSIKLAPAILRLLQ